MENRTSRPQQDLKEGPFIIDLKTNKGTDGIEPVGRLILGGPEGSREKMKEALKEIGSLPDGMDFDQLRSKAIDIFRSHDIVRVDF